MSYLFSVHFSWTLRVGQTENPTTTMEMRDVLSFLILVDLGMIWDVTTNYTIFARKMCESSAIAFLNRFGKNVCTFILDLHSKFIDCIDCIHGSLYKK